MSATVTSQSGALLDATLAAGRPALFGYIPLGMPTPDRAIEAVTAMLDAGADAVELGIPYTDPGVDGPVVQRAGEAALAAGTRVRDVVRVVEAVKAHAPAAPVLVMSYWNPVLRYGVDAFARDLAGAGGAGIITPDLIPDEASDWLAASDAHGLDRVFLAAPSSTPERLRITASASRGFVYAASVMGVTGTRTQVGEAAEQLVADTRAAGADHVCVGLGVSTGAQAAEVGRYADGVIVGSALLKTLQTDRPWAARLDDLQAVTAELAAGVARARKDV
ncbi:tryptophan synthase subunit alpha [Xylanimonas protaetiae]|uniref:Tryptophan synthase alpha chain n=1 Tax=Xylanimonas protaetiae TaxID=2509457 RepID=A0A4P6F5I2_9MICO|nr:tryptophan synthase subunit alpha [Xylanimonas protaetiae]QAY70874.1 tryptophan synthase subunit alpha [Xylanimonas protaetiae]